MAFGMLPLPSTDEQRKAAAWQKAFVVLGYDPALVRKDAYGWYIRWINYGDRTSAYGWEIDHHHATALGGLDWSGNLRALHWRNNASLGGLLSAALNRR